MARRGRGKHRHHRGEGQQAPGQQRSDHRHQSSGNQRIPQGQDTGRPRGERQQSGKASFSSITQPRRQVSRTPIENEIAPKKGDRSYKVIFFDTVSQAKADMDNLRALAANCDQLNIVVRAEGAMDDADLNSIGKLFCGAAWALIHERRRDDGWYDTHHE